MASSNIMLSKFKGTLIGALMGDCYGSFFEGQRNLSNLKKAKTLFIKKRKNKIGYTDDTALTIAVSKSLINSKKLNPSNMAECLIDEYVKDPNRGYASGARALFSNFNELKNENKLIHDCYKLPKEMFNGSGSFGNGSGMRISPMALHTYNMTDEEMTILTILAIKLTHTHPEAVIGGLLQCYAVREALKTEISSDGTYNSDLFLDNIINYINKIENDICLIEDHFKNLEKEKQNYLCADMKYYLEFLGDTKQNMECTYSDKLKYIREFYNHAKNGDALKMKDFYVTVGSCGVNAIESIPVALFALLIATDQRCAKEVDVRLDCDNSFEHFKPVERSILYAISLGGDTDTIASMCGAICGALFGIDNIEKRFYSVCEDYKLMFNCSKKIYCDVTKTDYEEEVHSEEENITEEEIVNEDLNESSKKDGCNIL